MGSSSSLLLFTYSHLSFYLLCRVKQEIFTAGILSPLVTHDSILVPPNLYAKHTNIEHLPEKQV